MLRILNNKKTNKNMNYNKLLKKYKYFIKTLIFQKPVNIQLS
jgi:hypothetical protein